MLISDQAKDLVKNCVEGGDSMYSFSTAGLHHTRVSAASFFGRRLFFGTNLKEKLLCWLKPTRQSSTLEFTRIMEENISSSGKLHEAARK